jgi:hypothetical protein
MMMKTRSIFHRTDVVVFGAGPAGLAAAVSAARETQRVCLLELNTSIGGVMSRCPGMMLGSGYVGDASVGGFFEEFVQRMYAMKPPVAERRGCGLQGFGDEVVYDPCAAIEILSAMLDEAGVDLRLATVPSRVRMDGERIAAVEAVDAQGSDSYEAGVYIDCTGDGDVAVKAGVPFEQGDENGRMMGATLTFFIENVDWDAAFAGSPDPYRMKDAERGIAQGRIDPALRQIYFLKGLRPGSVYFNTVTVTGVDGTDGESVLRATRVARRRAWDLAAFVRDELPGFRDAYVTNMGPLVGVRETRRLQGMYTLTLADIAAGKKPDDGIAACDSPLDDVFRDESEPVYSHEPVAPCGDYYTIPFRSLVPRTVQNLLFAGRNRSVEGKAFGSGRGMPQCMLMGQSAGVAAAMANAAGCSVQDVDRRALVERLVEQGVKGIGGRPL